MGTSGIEPLNVLVRKFACAGFPACVAPNVVVESGLKAMSQSKSQTEEPLLSGANRLFGWVCLVVCLPLAARGIYEKTVLTWREGPQMPGFTVSHTQLGLFFLGLFGTICLYGWLTAFVIEFFLGRSSGATAIPLSGWIQFAISMVVVATFWVPYGLWQIAAIDFAGPGPRATDQLVSAANGGQAYVVNALLERGVKVDARGSEAQTALNGACSGGREEVADLLVSKGAALDSAPACRKYAKFAALMKPEMTPVGSRGGAPNVPRATTPAGTSQ